MSDQRQGARPEQNAAARRMLQHALPHLGAGGQEARTPKPRQGGTGADRSRDREDTRQPGHHRRDDRPADSSSGQGQHMRAQQYAQNPPIGSDRYQNNQQQQGYMNQWPAPLATGPNQVAKVPPALANSDRALPTRPHAYAPAQGPRESGGRAALRGRATLLAVV